METKGGRPVPDDLAAAIQAREGLKSMWDRLEPSAQTQYAELVIKAPDPAIREQRIWRVLRMTVEWNLRHPPEPKPNPATRRSRTDVMTPDQ